MRSRRGAPTRRRRRRRTPNNVNLIENIERLGLPVDRIVPLHGRVVPVADLYVAAGKTPPR